MPMYDILPQRHMTTFLSSSPTQSPNRLACLDFRIILILSLSLLEYRNQRQRLSPSLGPWIALDHEFTLLIRSILILPIFTFLTKLIHFTGTNGTILLSTGETNDA